MTTRPIFFSAIISPKDSTPPLPMSVPGAGRLRRTIWPATMSRLIAWARPIASSSLASSERAMPLPDLPPDTVFSAV
jgi:hypothetical protein